MLGVGQDALGLAGDPDVGLSTEAELREVVAQLAGLEVARRQHRADVGRLREHAGERQAQDAVAEPVVDDAVAARQGRRHRHAGACRGLAGVDERAEGEHLLDGARLVDVGHRPGHAVLGVGRLGRAGVERRVVGQGEDLAGLGVHHDREAGVGAGVLDRLPQDPLRVPLEVEVDGGLEVLAVHRRLDGRVAERDPVAVADRVALRAVGAGQLLVEVALEAGERLVGADEAHQVGAHVAGRIVADRVVDACRGPGSPLPRPRPRRPLPCWPAPGARCRRSACPSGAAP